MTAPATFHIRPRFTVLSHESVEEVYHRFKTALSDKEAPFQGKVRLGYVSIYPKLEDHHYWSPHLSVIIEPEDENPEVTMLRGLYGPSPAVWTMFVFIYAIMALALVIVTVIGFANMSIDEPGTILWAVPVLLFLLASIYLTSHFGQQKGHGQIEAIDSWFDSIMSQNVEERISDPIE